MSIAGEDGPKGPFNEMAPPRPAYSTARGQMFWCTAEQFLHSSTARTLRGSVQLLFTSPPFPLKRQKAYRNLTGEEFVDWLADFAPKFKEMLTPDGSIVIELGNAWNPGEPTMSTLPLEALLEFKRRGGLHVCQLFVCYNPARLPGPAQWVNIERVRVKDAFTHVWWFSRATDPKANNRNVLEEYSESMKRLLESQSYNAGKRPSEHDIGETSFLRDNGGAIPSNVLEYSNTVAYDRYLDFCREGELKPHPARMPSQVARFFIDFLTDTEDLVFDPFAGSNVTGAVAERQGREWIALEPVQEYVLGSTARFENAQILLPDLLED